MDEKLQKQLVRQLKILNFWITTFGVLFLIALAIIGFMLFKVITFMNDTQNSIRQFQQNTTEKLDVKQQACKDDSAFGKFLRENTEICR